MTRNRWLTTLLGTLTFLHCSLQLQAAPWQPRTGHEVGPVAALRIPTLSPGSSPVSPSSQVQSAGDATNSSPSVEQSRPNGKCTFPDAPKRHPGIYSSDEPVAGEVVLTFDDGPHPSHTPAILDTLAEFQMPATFFIVGAAVNRKTYPLIQRMKADGHDLGSHTYNHDIELASRRWDDGDYIEGQYVLGQIMVELALLARSPDHFDELHTEVFGVPSARRQSVASIRRHWHEYRDHHQALLQRLGYTDESRPHDWLLSRPPGGLPYIVRGRRDGYAVAKHEGALSRLGWLTILWHGGAGDTDIEHRHELPFLLGNLQYHSRRGGVLLIHDYVRKDALRAALTGIRNSPKQHVITLRTLVERKYGCTATELAHELGANPGQTASEDPIGA